MNSRVARRERQRRPVLLGGLAKFPIERERAGQVHMRVGVIGVLPNFGAKIGDGFGNLPLSFLECPEVQVDSRKVGAQSQHLPILF